MGSWRGKEDQVITHNHKHYKLQHKPGSQDVPAKAVVLHLQWGHWFDVRPTSQDKIHSCYSKAGGEGTRKHEVGTIREVIMDI